MSGGDVRTIPLAPPPQADSRQAEMTHKASVDKPDRFFAWRFMDFSFVGEMSRSLLRQRDRDKAMAQMRVETTSPHCAPMTAPSAVYRVTRIGPEVCLPSLLNRTVRSTVE